MRDTGTQQIFMRLAAECKKIFDTEQSEHLEVAQNIKMDVKKAKKIADEVKDIVYADLGKYLR